MTTLSGIDRHFVSFPKSGRSWVRYALVNLGLADQVTFQHDGFEYNDGTRPALDFAFSKFATDLERKRIVYLHRDPRDVMVSLFHQVTGRFSDFYQYRGTISEFIRDPYFGAGNLRRFRQHWAEICEQRRALAVSYEECHVDFGRVLAAVAHHYEFELDGPAIDSVAGLTSFENMRALEQSGQFDEPWLRLRNGSPKVRRGRIGSYLEELSPADIDYLNVIFGL